MVPHNRPQAQIALVNIRAGALIEGDWIDVHETAIPAPSNGQLTDVELVGDEIWVAAPFWIYRYEARGDRRFVTSFPVGAPVRSIEAQSAAQGNRVLITTTDSLLIYDRVGTLLSEVPVAGAGDTLELPSSMLIAIQDDSRVDRYTFDGQFIETFAGPDVPTSLGVLSNPKQLSQRLNGNILVAGDVRVFEFSPTGSFIGEYDIGPFEGGIIESVSGRIFVSLQDGAALYDATTGRTTPVTGGLTFGQGRRIGYFDEGTRATLTHGDWSSDVLCRSVENSAGLEAHAAIMGSADLEDASLSIFVDRMPPFAQGRLMLATDQAFTPMGSMGNFCLDQRSRFFIGGAERADSVGHAQFRLVQERQSLVEFAPGMTWCAQSIYRDGDALRLSSAIVFTLSL